MSIYGSVESNRYEIKNDYDSDPLFRPEDDSVKRAFSDQLRRSIKPPRYYASHWGEDDASYSAASTSPSVSPIRERGACPKLELLGSIIHTVAGVVLPCLASATLVSSVASACHTHKEIAVGLFTVYGYSVVAAVATTLFASVTQGCKENCEQDCEQKGQVWIKSIKNVAQVEGVIVNTVTGPIALCYFIVQLMRSEPSLHNGAEVISV